MKCRYKRIRKSVQGKPDESLYQVRKEALELLEQQSRKGSIARYYGDESQVSTEGCVPYGWQFPDEQVSTEAAKGKNSTALPLSVELYTYSSFLIAAKKVRKHMHTGFRNWFLEV